MKEDGVCISIANGFRQLKRIEIHKLDDKRYDRRGRIVSFFFKTFPNREYLKMVTTVSVRALTALLNSIYVLMDLEYYPHSEMNDCWVHYDNASVDQHIPGHVVVSVHHKYWGKEQTQRFVELAEVMARINGADIVDERKESAGCGVPLGPDLKCGGPSGMLCMECDPVNYFEEDSQS